MNIKLHKTFFWLSLLLFIILLPNIYLLFKGIYFEETSIIKKVSFIILSVALVLPPLIFIKPKYYFIICTIFTLMVPCEIINIYIYGSTLNTGIIIATFNTSIKESIEFLKLFFPFVIISIIIISAYLLIIIKRVSFNFSLIRLHKVVIAIAFLLTISALWLRDIIISHNTLRGLSFTEIFVDGTNNFTNKFSKIFPLSTIIQTSRAIDIICQSGRYEKNLEKFKFESYKKDSCNLLEKYVLIIGESSRSCNYQLYGYKRNTNPELINIPNLEVIQDAASTSNLTSLCFPLLLTRATPEKFNISNEEKTLVSAFKESGFKTYWISNQGVYNSNLARFVVDVDKVYNLNSFFDLKGQYDEVIFPYLDSIITRNEHKQLIIINLMGSHFNYNLRYPAKYSIYKPDFEGNTDYFAIQPSNKERIINSYDNSIVYTDFIVASVIKRIQKTNSVSFLFYLSDHGENLYDNSKNMFGHGNNTPTQYEIQIPFIVWHSAQYDSIYPNKIKALQINKNVRASSRNLFYSLLDGANIGFKGNDISKSIFSKDFKEDSIRYILLPNMNVKEYDRKHGK